MIEHKWVDIHALSDEEEGSQPDRIAKACDKLALDGWEIVTSVWTTSHLLLRRSFAGPKPATIANSVEAVLGKLIEDGFCDGDFDIRVFRKLATEGLLELWGHGTKPATDES